MVDLLVSMAYINIPMKTLYVFLHVCVCVNERICGRKSKKKNDLIVSQVQPQFNFTLLLCFQQIFKILVAILTVTNSNN